MAVLIPVLAGAATASTIGGIAALGGAATFFGAIAGGIVAAGVSRLIGIGESPDSLLDAAKRGRLQNFAGSVEPIPVIYGRRRIGGPFVLRESIGDRNQLIYLVLPLCEGPIDAVETIHLGERLSTDARIVPYFHSIVRLGTAGQVAVPFMVSEVSIWTDAAVGEKLAYLALRFKWEDDTDNRPVWPTGIPTVTTTLRGRTLFDPRTSTTAYSNNPALAIRDYLTNTLYGRGVDLSRIDDASFEDSADYCDEQVSSPGGSQARYTLDAIVDTSRTLRENLEDMLATCRGLLTFSGGQWQLRMDRPETGLAWEFNETNIAGRWSISTGSAADRPNRVKVTWVDPDDDFQPKVSLIGSDAMLEADQGQVLESQLDLSMVTNRYRAEQIAGVELKQARQSISAEFTATLEGLRAQAADVVPISHETPGWDAKLFRIWRLAFTHDDMLRIAVREYDDSVFVLDDLDTAPVQEDTNLPDPWLTGEPENLAVAGGTAELLIGSDGTIVSRLYVSWDPPQNARAAGYEVDFKPSRDGLGWTRTSTTATDTYIQPVQDRRQYDVRVRSINIFNRRSDWVYWIGFQVTGKTEPPPNVLEFSVDVDPDGTRLYIWEELDRSEVPDLAGYLIRYHSGANTDWDTGTRLHNGFLTSSPYEVNRPPGGTYTFAIRAVDTSKNVSASSKLFSRTLPDPRLGQSIAQQYARAAGWPGTLTDCVNRRNVLEAIDDGTWATTPATWAAWTVWPVSPRSPISYEHVELNFGASTSGSIVIDAVTGGGTELLEMRFHNGTVWGAYAAPPATFTGQFRTQMRVTVTGAAPTISALSLIIYP